MTDTQFFIEKYRTLVETRIGWGKSDNWQSQDFETLSGEIFKKTGVLLSASTLKRIWGKVRYNSTPNLATLDALARFVDFPNWRSFCHWQEEATAALEEPKVTNRKYRIPLLVTVVTIVLTLIAFILQRQSVKTLRYSNIRFSSKPVTNGIPNTVIFKYDATRSNADSVFIQQNWDKRRRFRVDKNRHEYSSTYYLPGYYRAKLVLDDSVVKEHDLLIESDWIGVLQKEPIPGYLPRELYMKDGSMGLEEADVNIGPKDYQNEPPVFLLSRVAKDMEVPSEAFELSMLLQNTFTRVSAPCRQASVMLLGTGGVIRIPMSAPGCVGDLLLLLGDRAIDGKTHNLSGFGVDFNKPVQLRCAVSSAEIGISLNGTLVFRDKFPKGIGRIVGVRIAFTGSGTVSNFKLSSLRKD
ncbi:hypothetical protein [Pararcticibacter amylolyticus]|uniref:Uncharacterized protein n=1 Tax=Pararcticibacter amylolyticus TaxID=2173175 RepID=A0A2U2PJ16_9SPHI|nr:hypothetical protein [Pararcticibacter amylolyticus]PWG81398.1 hypothetical protein DDR33_06030 [Pararcticibacter amylolyticus]